MKKAKALFLAVLFVLLAAVSVSAAPSITLNKTSKTLYAGADKLGYRRVSLVPTLNGITGKVRYKSSKPSVVKVNSAGRAYALSKGTAVVTAYVKADGKTYTATCRITVKNPSIVFKDKNFSVKVGETKKAAVTVTPKSTVKWSVYNAKKASIDQNGNVKGLKAGATYIYAEANGIKKKLRVTIEKKETTDSLLYESGKALKAFVETKGYRSYFPESVPSNFKYAILDIDKDGINELLVETTDSTAFSWTTLFRYNASTKKAENVPLVWSETEKKSCLYHYSTTLYNTKYNCLSYALLRNTRVDAFLIFVTFDGANTSLYKYFHIYNYTSGSGYEINGTEVTEEEFKSHTNYNTSPNWIKIS